VRGRVLCYHSVGTPQWGVNDVAPARFQRHLEIARSAGYRFVSAAEIAETGGGPIDLALTFDDGLASVTKNVWPLLAERGIPWTLFIVTGWAAGGPKKMDRVLMHWAEIEQMVRSGAAIGSHSVSHPNFSALTRDQMAFELSESRRSIESRIGITPSAFAIPFGRARDWPAIATGVAREAGYTAIYAGSEDRCPSGTLPRTFITRSDDDRTFMAALGGAFDNWEETF
jgi:peptidoglycan/xylan/chitin deacetylase (PgdA/CDA1 family)